MFNLDTFRLIRKTIKRFLSLTLIVLIGSGFMMGLMSTPTIMKKSVDVFNDEYNLQDLQIYSQYGFCFEDYLALKKSDVIENIFPSKFTDLESELDNNTITIRISEFNRSVNKFELTQGRYPYSENECVILESAPLSSLYELEDTITFDEKDCVDLLRNNKYMIVGKVKSPEFISTTLETSTLNNQSLNLVMYVLNTNFLSEYYTSMFIQLKDAEKYVSYTRQYNNFINDKSIDIENISFEQQSFLKDQIANEISDKIKESEEKFIEEKTSGEQKLNDAAKQLEEANIKIISYESELNSLSMIINRLQTTVNMYSDDIDNGTNQVESILGQYNLSLDILYSNEVQEYAKSALDEAKKSYNNLYYQLNIAKAQYEDGLKEYNEAVLTFNDEISKAEAEIKKAKQDLDDLPNAKWTLLKRDLHYSSYMYENNCNQMSAIGYALPLIFFLVAALVCLTTMKRLVDEQRGQIGIFVALGFSKIQIIGKYVLYALLASFIGCSFGIIIGQSLFPTVIYHTWRLMYDLPDIKLLFPFRYILLSYLSFGLLMGLVTAYVVYTILKQVPATLLRPMAPKNAKEILLEKFSFIWNKLSFTSKITARNIFRYKSRFFMTIIGVAGCTALLILGWGIKDSISDVVNIQYSDIFNYNYQIYLENSHHIDESIEKLRSSFDNEEVVKYMSFTTRAYFDNDDDTANLIIIDPRDAYVIFNLRDKDKITPLKINNDGVIVSEKFAKNNNIKKGDYITLESKQGIKAIFKVSNICEMYFQHYIFMSQAVYEEVFDEKANFTTIAVKTHDPDTLISDAAKLDDYISIVDFSSFIEQFNIMIDALSLIIAVIIITAGSLAFVVLMNITQVNISERIREIATLKVLGFNNNEVNLYIFKEILLLTLIGSLLGIPLGIIEHHFIMNVINMEMIMFAMNIKTLSFIYAVVITFVFTLIVLIFMRKPLRNINMVESLKSVE